MYEGENSWPAACIRLSNTHISHFGAIQKSSLSKWRLIVDLSSPEEHSFNDGIREDSCSLKYVPVDNAVEKLGQGAQLAKVDMRSVYPVSAENRCMAVGHVKGWKAIHSHCPSVWALLGTVNV